MGRREINTEIFRDTIEFVDGSDKLLSSVVETRNRQRMIPESERMPSEGTLRAEYGQDAKVFASGKRTLEAASAYRGKKTCILNFASATNPGGGVLSGSSAQEESICRCSTLYFCLQTPEMIKNFYMPHREAGDPLYNDDIIYSPDVQVIKTDASMPERMEEADWYPVNVITCAAPNLREHPSNSMNPNVGRHAAQITEQELSALLEKRIRRIFAAAAADHNSVLVLGAFGCGAFRNPPELVADVFFRVTQEYLRSFETIEYAVFHTAMETQNYEAFLRKFGKEA